MNLVSVISNKKYKVGLINVIFPEDGTLKERRHDFIINGMSCLEF
jgi:hypothetical protein